MVFICEMIPGSLNQTESETLGLLTEEIYRELKYSTFILKASSIAERLQIVLETIQAI